MLFLKFCFPDIPDLKNINWGDPRNKHFLTELKKWSKELLKAAKQNREKIKQDDITNRPPRPKIPKYFKPQDSETEQQKQEQHK